jgi:hypothetical protein
MSVSRLGQEVSAIELTYWEQHFRLEKEESDRRAKKPVGEEDTIED